MPRGHHRRRVSVHESPRAWAFNPTSDPLLRGLPQVRRSARPLGFTPVTSPFVLPSRTRRVIEGPPRLPPKKRVSPRGLFAPTMADVAFARPDLVLTCLRRKMRREVMHALGFTRRRGSGGGSRKRFTLESLVKC